MLPQNGVHPRMRTYFQVTHSTPTTSSTLYIFRTFPRFDSRLRSTKVARSLKSSSHERVFRATASIGFANVSLPLPQPPSQNSSSLACLLSLAAALLLSLSLSLRAHSSLETGPCVHNLRTRKDAAKFFVALLHYIRAPCVRFRRPLNFKRAQAW